MTTPATKQTEGPGKGLAIASMVVGIVAFLTGWTPFWGLAVGITAVVLGIIGLKKGGEKGLAITGIVTGGLAALTSLDCGSQNGFHASASVALTSTAKSQRR